jgi:hypothetical protein
VVIVCTSSGPIIACFWISHSPDITNECYVDRVADLDSFVGQVIDVNARLSHRSRWLGILPRRPLLSGGGGGPLTHPLATRAFRPAFWPPFFSLSIFRPRLIIRLRNGGAALTGWSVALFVMEYTGPLGSMPAEASEWLEIERKTILQSWPAGEERQLRFKLRSTSLAVPGTYVFRFSVQEQRPVRDGLWRGNDIAAYGISEYFRIEPMSTVLTFQLVFATALLALATLALALVDLLK